MSIFIVPDLIVEILTHIKPKINFGLINKQFYNIHQEGTIYKTLIKKHYPNSFITDTPTKQYQALVNKKYTDYIFVQDLNAETCITDSTGEIVETFAVWFDKVYLYNYVDRRHDRFKIKGLKPNNGDIYWILSTIYAHHTKIKVFTTYQNCVNYFINRKYFKIITAIFSEYYNNNIIDKECDYVCYKNCTSNCIINKCCYDKCFHNITSTREFKSFVKKYIPFESLDKESFINYITENLFFNWIFEPEEPDGEAVFHNNIY